MQLDELLEILAFGELAGTANVDNATDQILPDKYPKVISYINRGLTQLHTLFLLKEDIVTVRHLANKTTYFLHSDFSDETGGLDPYISDSPFKPFNDNILMIEYMNDELGDPLVVNDYEDPLSYFTPGHITVEVNVINPETVFHVIYRANHDVLPSQPADPALVLVNIPRNFIDALCYFVASKAFASINSSDSRKASVLLHQLFMQEITLLKANGQGALNFNPLPEDVRKSGWL